MIVKMIMNLTSEGSYEFNDILLQKYLDTYKKRFFLCQCLEIEIIMLNVSNFSKIERISILIPDKS